VTIVCRKEMQGQLLCGSFRDSDANCLRPLEATWPGSTRVGIIICAHIHFPNWVMNSLASLTATPE